MIRHCAKVGKTGNYFAWEGEDFSVMGEDMTDDDVPVFDRKTTETPIIDQDCEWTPRHSRRKRGNVVLMDGDPLPRIFLSTATEAEFERFRRNGCAWYASEGYDGQAANDNEDWPLQKLLRTEGNSHCLALAERYRDLHDTAMQPTQMIGREPEDLYEVQNRDKHGRWKGPKIVTGKRSNQTVAPARMVAANEDTKKRAAPVQKKWNGDWPILAAIDAKRELAIVRAKLAYVPKIIDAFEWSVVDSLTLEEIGKRLGAGSKGAKGEARARVFDGFEIVDRHWRSQERKAA